MPSRKSQTLIQLKNTRTEAISELFSIADSYGALPGIESKKDLTMLGRGKTGALLFFEASTRTRMSFETACARLGVHALRLDGKSGTSLEKGESLEDTVLNVAAMKPAFLVIRSSDELDFEKMSQQVPMPIINAGWGLRGHPTQALLDAYTMRKNFQKCEGQKVLIVGDIRHSRVAASHFELAKILGYEIGLCAPAEFLPEQTTAKVFSNLQDGLSWATVAMTLRVQLERHTSSISLTSYRETYGFTSENLKALSLGALIMHPGPINHGTELDSEVLRDPRCRVLDQVSNGVLIRQALIHKICEQEMA